MAKEYSTTIDLRFSDLDLYGHVNSAIYFTYLETARVKQFKDVFEQLTSQGIFVVVVSAECNYKIPILLNDTVVVSGWISRIGNTSFDIEYKIHNGSEKIFATAKTTMVCIKGVLKRPTPVPGLIKDLA